MHETVMREAKEMESELGFILGCILLYQPVFNTPWFFFFPKYF